MQLRVYTHTLLVHRRLLFSFLGRNSNISNANSVDPDRALRSGACNPAFHCLQSFIAYDIYCLDYNNIISTMFYSHLYMAIDFINIEIT